MWWNIGYIVHIANLMFKLIITLMHFDMKFNFNIKLYLVNQLLHIDFFKFCVY